MTRETLAETMAYSELQAGRVRKELARQRGVTEKEMFGGIAFLLSGNMAVGVHGEDLIVRVDPVQTDALLREPGAKPFDLSGSRGPPAGWLLVAPSGYRADPALRTWVARGIAYASSLPKKGPPKSKAKR
jgi:TfoX/Sxy family transcriptional regulator of competence genes